MPSTRGLGPSQASLQGWHGLSRIGGGGAAAGSCHHLPLAVDVPLEPMSGLALFLIVFFSLVAAVFAVVIGIIVYNKWQEQSRKHFY